MAQTTATSASLSPQESIIGMLVGIVMGRCLVAAAELELADALANGPLSVETIAAQTKANASNLFRLMRALETLGIFKQVSPRVFENTPLSECLRKDVPGSIWALVRVIAPGWGYWTAIANCFPRCGPARQCCSKPGDTTSGSTIEGIPNNGWFSMKRCAE